MKKGEKVLLALGALLVARGPDASAQSYSISSTATVELS